MSHFVSTKQLIQSPENKQKRLISEYKMPEHGGVIFLWLLQRKYSYQNFHLAIVPESMIQIFKSLLNEVKKFRSIPI